MKTKQIGFTLVEIMVVVVILGILVGLAIPAVSQHNYRNKANEALADARMLQNALIMYRDEVSDVSSYSSAGDNWSRVQLIIADNRWESAPASLSSLNPSSNPWTISAPASINGSVTLTKDSSSVSVNQIRKIGDMPNY